MEMFWVHRGDMGDNVGFGQFSIGHFAWLGAMVVLSAIIILYYENSLPAQRSNIRKFIAIFLMFADVLKLCVMGLTGVNVVEYLPLEICSFGSYFILIDAMWPENKFFPQMLTLLFLPAAIMALLFPTVSDLPLINFYTAHQFIFHALIATYILSRFISKEYQISYSGLWASVIKICCIALPIYFVDVKFGKTYMFLTHHFNNPLLKVIWDITGGGVPYTLGLVAFVIVVLHIFFFIFKGISKLLR